MSRTLIAAVSLIVGGSAVVAGTALQADAAPAAKPVTMSFTAKQSGVVILSKTAYTLADTDVENGKKVGVDSLVCTDTSGTQARCKVAFASKGGIILGDFTLDDSSGALAGHVSGGNGAFSHASGTLTGQVVSRSAVLVKLVFTR